jgi:hypothetical protein
MRFERDFCCLQHSKTMHAERQKREMEIYKTRWNSFGQVPAANTNVNFRALRNKTHQRVWKINKHCVDKRKLAHFPFAERGN